MTTKDTDTHNTPPATEPLALRLSEGLGAAAQDMACTCNPDDRPKECTMKYALSACRATDLYERLESMSKSLEYSGRIDEHDNPDAYRTVLETMNYLRLYCGA
jgi:hypothetical protein